MAARVASVVGAAALGCLVARAAHAEPPSQAALIWRAPDSCPDAGEVRARIERRLGAPIERVVHGVAVDVAVHRDGAAPRYVARIDLRGMRGGGGSGGGAPADDELRVLTSARCDELTDAVAVVIARLAAEDSGRAAGAGSTTKAAAPSGGELQAVRAAPRPLPGAAATSAWGGGLRLVGLSGIGALPGVSVGGELGGYVRAGWLIVEVAGMTWLDNKSYLAVGGPARVDVGLALAALRIGWGPEDLPLRAWLSGELGTLRGESVALASERVESGRWLAVGAGFAVAWPMFTHARLVGTIELAVPVERARFMLEDGSEVYRSSRAAVRSGLGVELGWR